MNADQVKMSQSW